MLFNPSTEFGAKVAQRVETERLVWLRTVSSDGTPPPKPSRP